MLTISMLIMLGSFLMSLSRLVAHGATATAEPEAFLSTGLVSSQGVLTHPSRSARGTVRSRILALLCFEGNFNTGTCMCLKKKRNQIRATLGRM